MPNYLDSKIYKLCCKDVNIKDIYIGSTSQLLCKRKSAHKNSCNDEYNSKKYNLKVYNFIRDNGGFNNWDLILLDNVPCNNKEQLYSIERSYIENLKPSLNSQKPLGQNHSHYQNNIQKKIKSNINRNEKFNCVCGGKHTYNSKSQHLKTKKHLEYLNK